MTKELVLRIRIPSREEIEEISERLAKNMADTIAGRMEEVEKWAKGLPANIGLPKELVKVDIVERPPEPAPEAQPKQPEKPAEEKPAPAEVPPETPPPEPAPAAEPAPGPEEKPG